MAKIPDATALGVRPSPDPRGGVPNIAAVGGPVQAGTGAIMNAANQSGAGALGFASGLERAGELIAAGEERIRTRQDAVSRARAYLSYSEAADTELRRLSTEADLADLKTVDKYSAFLRDLTQKTMGEHGGSKESSLMLEQQLEGVRHQFSAKVSAMSMEAGDKAVMDLMGGKINSLAMSMWDSPGSLKNKFDELDRSIDDMAPALRPELERALRRTGRERIAEAALGSLISRGGIDAAEKLMNTPGLSEILGERAQTRIQNQIITARQVITNAQNMGIAERMRLTALLGRPPTQDELLGRKPSDQTVEVGDANSPTGTRIIPRDLVKPNVPAEVLAQYPPGKPPSGLDIKFGPDGKPISITTGRPGGTAPGLGTEGSNAVDKDMLNALQTRQSLQSITERFKPEFQQIPTKLGMEWAALKDKGAGVLGKVSEKERADLDEFKQFRAEAGQLFSNILKQLSGVAVNPTEFKRAEAYLPFPGTGVFDGDSPIELEAKTKRFIEFNDKAIARLAYTKAHGLKFDDIQLDDMPRIIRKRGDELAAELSKKGMAGDAIKDEVRARIAKEFGFIGQ